MILHTFLIAVFSIWLIKLAEKHFIEKKFAVLLGALLYVAFALGIHYSLFIFGTKIYDQSQLIHFLNVLSGFMGICIAAFIISFKGKRKQKKLRKSIS